MRITELKDRGRFRIRVSPTEMSALNKLVELGLMVLRRDVAVLNPLTTSERKASAYWRGNPFRGLPKKKPRRRPGTTAKSKGAASPRPTAKTPP